MPWDPATDFNAYLLSAPAGELRVLLEEEKESLTEEHVLAILKNRNITQEILRAVLSHPPFLVPYAVKKALVFLRLTPQINAIHLVPHLFWMDLMEAASHMTLHPLVRRAAEKRLLERLPEMGIGERVTLARRGTRAVLMALRGDDDGRVIQAFLQNRFMTEEIVLSMAGNSRTAPEILGLLAYSPKWSVHYEVRKTLVLNPSTPPFIAAFLVRKLRATDIADLAGSKTISPAVRNACQAMMGKGGKKVES
jgi:hypothetical protein